MVRIEPLVLSVNQGFPENGCHVLVVDGCAVLAKELSYLLAVSTIDFRCLGWPLVLNHLHRRRLAEKPQEVDINGQ